MTERVNWVVDADIRNFFGHLRLCDFSRLRLYPMP
jgi:hypothetical protein